MKTSRALVQGVLLFVASWGLAYAQVPESGSAGAGVPMGPLRALAPDAETERADGPGAPAGPGARDSGGASPSAGVHEVDLGKIWNVSPEYFRKVFDGAGEDGPSGLNAKIDAHIYGVIRTKWGPADMLFGSMARFFAASPVLLDREYAVRRAVLYD